jgi:lipopolysaccharide export LptBFGC system permease protein LptF
MTQKRIFISYRRSDASGHAGRLYDYLKDYFGAERIFFDVDTIQAGTNFEQRITNELDNSDAALVLIGNQWLDIKDKEGNRRLDNPHDYVRFEVETAVGKNIPVIPVLLQGVQMPSANILPETLYDLSRRNAIRLNDDHWKSDCNLLIGILKNALHVSRSLKERKIRSYRRIVFTLAALVTLFAVLSQTALFSNPGQLIYMLLGSAIKNGLILFGVVNVALVTYLLGNIKKELDRLSWIIISIAIIGGITSVLGGPLILWSALAMMLVAGLLNFVEPDE